MIAHGLVHSCLLQTSVTRSSFLFSSIMMAPIIFYDLTVNDVEPGTGPLFSPNTWITRMVLLQMQLDFRVVELDLQALRSPYFMDVLGDRPLVPLIELPKEGGANSIAEPDKVGALLGGPEWVFQRGKPQGQLIMDSQGIAAFLAEKYPAQPSPYLPDAETPLTEQDQRALRVAKTYAQLVKLGMGTSDARWGWHFELSAPAIAQRYSGEDRAFYEGDIKNGKGGWAKIMAMDRGEEVIQDLSAFFSTSSSRSQLFHSQAAS